MEFPLRFRGSAIVVHLTTDQLTLSANPEGVNLPISVGVGDEVRELCPGDRLAFELPTRSERSAGANR